MKKINIYNPRIPYFIMYRKGGWVFYNREYKNLFTEEPEYKDDPKKIYYIPAAVISKLSKEFNPSKPTEEYQRVFLHDNPNMVGAEKKAYIKKLLLLIDYNVDPLNIRLRTHLRECISKEDEIKEIERFLIELSN